MIDEVEKERNSFSRCVERKRRGEFLRNNFEGGKATAVSWPAGGGERVIVGTAKIQARALTDLFISSHLLICSRRV